MDRRIGMKLFMSSLAALFAGALIGFSPAWVQSAETTPKPPAETKKTPSKTDRLDINTASAKDLRAIRGINEAQAKKIIEGRPYKRRNELVSKKIITQETFDKIKDQISAKPPTKG
jgi:competence protein ComEA